MVEKKETAVDERLRKPCIVQESGSELWITSYRDPADQNPVEKALQEEVKRIMCKEINYWPRLDDRGFGAHTLSTDIFDFIRVCPPDEESDERFLMILYPHSNVNHYSPSQMDSEYWNVYPLGFKEEVIRNQFRRDLEKGKIPKQAMHQVAVRIGPGGGNRYNAYYPCCIEVTDKEDIKKIEEFVARAVVDGLRDEIIDKSPEDMKEILERIENDYSLDFDYWAGRG